MMTTSKKQQFEDRQARIENIVSIAGMGETFSDTRYRIEVRAPEIKVYEIGGNLVAYSSTKADFEQSLVEFVTDYFV